jgi:hypothetical protein
MKIACFTLIGAVTATLDDGSRPVAKVKKLLLDMKQELEGEQAEDEESKEKMDCWCHSNGEAKKQAIVIGNKQIDAHTATIEAKTSLSAKIKAEIAALKDEIKKNMESLNKATGMRDEEAAQFHDEEKDLLQSIDALKNALVVLGKHNSASMVSVQSVLKQALAGHNDILADMSAPKKDVVTSFLQLSQPAHFKSYAPQSGQIFGILEEMKEQFENNLAKAQKSELSGKESYAQLKASKEEEISAAKEAVSSKEEELADSNQATVNAQSDLEDSQNALAADTAFLKDLEERCASFDAEFAERAKTRADEIAAVGEAMSILNSPEAFELFGKTTTQTSKATMRQQTFLQVGAVSARYKQARDKAMGALAKVARSSQDPRLALLATTIQNAPLEGAVKAVEGMIDKLKQKSKDEIKKRDWCREELFENDKQMDIGNEQKGFLETKTDELKSQIKTLTTEIEEAQASAKELGIQLSRAGEDRNAENNEFQQTVADQRATQAILKKVINRLQQFYDKKEALLQAGGRQDPTPGADAPPPPPGFKTYEKKEGGNQVVNMIQEIVDESQRLENEAIQAENDAQAAYEDFVKKSNGSVGALQQAVMDKTATRADAKQELIQAEQDLKGTNGELENLSGYRAELHGECDFLIANFETRQNMRADEIEGMREAKDILLAER